MSSHGNVVYAFNNGGFYVGKEFDYDGPMPHNCVSVKPEAQEGYIPQWNGKDWFQVEDHRGRTGYVNGEHVMITEYGPLPEGWSDEYIDPRSEKEIRKGKIMFRLAEIDRLSVRAMRALRLGNGSAEDEIWLNNYEREAKALRSELATL